METLTENQIEMTCTKCGASCKRFGKHRNGLQRFRCRLCGATFTEDHEAPFRVKDYLKQARGIMAIQLTNAFSKKYENHRAAIALHFAYYNFCQIHRTLRVTPAMEAKITDRVWTIAELVG